MNLNTTTHNRYPALNKDELKELCAEIKETPLTEKKGKTFTATDMWQIHKNRRAARIRRY